MTAQSQREYQEILLGGRLGARRPLRPGQKIDRAGHEYDDAAKRAGALKKANEAIEFSPYYHSGYYLKGLALSALQQVDSAEANFELAIKYNPKHGGGHVQSGIIYYQRKEYQKALDMYDQAMPLNPTSCRRFIIGGWLNSRLAIKKAAAKDLSKAMQMGLPMAKQNYQRVWRGSQRSELRRFALRAAQFSTEKTVANILGILIAAQKLIRNCSYF